MDSPRTRTLRREIREHCGEAVNALLAIEECIHREVAPETCSVLAALPAFRREASVLERTMQGLARPINREIICGVNEGEIAPNDLVGAKSCEILRAGVPAGYVADSIEQYDSLRRCSRLVGARPLDWLAWAHLLERVHLAQRHLHGFALPEPN